MQSNRRGQLLGITVPQGAGGPRETPTTRRRGRSTAERPLHRLEQLLSLQLEVSRLLVQAAELDEVGAVLLEVLGGRLGLRAATLWLLGDGGDLRPLAVWKAPGATGAPAVPRAGVLAGEAQATKSVVTASHLGAAVPVVADRLYGVVELLGSLPPDEDLRTVLVDLGIQIGQFVRRAQAEDALRRTVDQLTRIAATDPLTGVRNRRAFERALAGVGDHFSVLAVDVDNLKPVNDEYGHEAGDAVLRTVAASLVSMVRGTDLVARIGGDEFVVLLPGAGAHEAATVAERMRTTMHGVAAAHQPIRISIGWASSGRLRDPRVVWRAADTHLTTAKRRGRDRVEGAPLDLPTRLACRGTTWEERVDDLLASHSVPMLYQPLVALDDRRVLGYEALARPWGTAATASVEDLFRAAHRAGRVRDLDWLCRRMALEQAPWTLPGWLLFVNVSTAALLDPLHDVDQMLLLCRAAGADPERLVLEITEREPVGDYERLGLVLAAYREHGIRFALDDLGEGHSTLELLAAADPEFLKVARTLTAAAPRSSPHAVVRALVTFAAATGATVLAEGVEDEVAVERMRHLGVTVGQGFHLGIPVTAAEITGDALPVPPEHCACGGTAGTTGPGDAPPCGPAPEPAFSPLRRRQWVSP